MKVKVLNIVHLRFKNVFLVSDKKLVTQLLVAYKYKAISKHVTICLIKPPFKEFYDKCLVSAYISSFIESVSLSRQYISEPTQMKVKEIP